jgi:hypothetical protein
MTDNTMREAFENCSLHDDYVEVKSLEENRKWFSAGWQAAQSVPVVGDVVAYWFPTTLGTMEQVDDPKDAYVEFDAYAKLAATSITQAELDAKDARIRELEEANASLEASYRGSCMMYDATKVELKALRKDAERYRWIRSASVGPATVWHVCMEHLEGGLLTLKSDYCLDTAIDSAIAQGQTK